MNDIVKKEENALLSVNADLMQQALSESDDYVDDTSADDIIIPRVRILQALSDELKKNSGEFIKEAEEGDILNTISKEIYKAEHGFLFIPVTRQISYIEWKDRKQGGGIVNHFGSNPEEFLSCEENEKGQRISERGNLIVKTYDFYGFILDSNFKAFEVLLSMSKSQARKAKHFNTLIRQLCDPKTGKQMPEYFGVYQINTIPESNESGSWFNYNVKFKGYTLAIPENGKLIYNRAKEFYDSVKSNEVVAKIEDSDLV